MQIPRFVLNDKASIICKKITARNWLMQNGYLQVSPSAVRISAADFACGLFLAGVI
jgi:hypothetical protein